MAKRSIFLSYSYLDDQYQREVASHLAVLRHAGDIDVWSDHRIHAGDDWYPAIVRAIETADVAVLLVSTDFLASPFVTKEEVPRLLQRRAQEGLRVIPIIVRNVALNRIPWLNPIEVRPKGKALSALTKNAREAALAKITEEIAGFLDAPVVTKPSTPVPSVSTKPLTRPLSEQGSPLESLCIGCWLKISGNGFVFVVQFFPGGTLLEANIFDLQQIWPGNWRPLAGDAVEMRVETDAVYVLRFDFATDKSGVISPILRGLEVNSVNGPSVTTQFRLVHVPELKQIG